MNRLQRLTLFFLGLRWEAAGTPGFWQATNKASYELAARPIPSFLGMHEQTLAPPRPLLTGSQRLGDKRLAFVCSSESQAAAPKTLEEDAGRRRLMLVDWSDHLVPYDLAWRIQHALLESQQRQLPGQTLCDVAILLQHPSVYTLGQGASEAFLAPSLKRPSGELQLPESFMEAFRERDGVRRVLSSLQREAALRLRRAEDETPSASTHEAEVFRVERGGQVTWHGRGQLVLYPVLDLRRHRTDVRWFVEALEESAALVLRSLALPQKQAAADLAASAQEPLGLLGVAERGGSTEAASTLKLQRHRDMPGVWADGEKICALGVRIRRWICFHGAALNVCNSLKPYELIVPCGLRGKAVTTAQRWLKALDARSSHWTRSEKRATRSGECYDRRLIRAAAQAWRDSLKATFGFGTVQTVGSLEELASVFSREAESSAGAA